MKVKVTFVLIICFLLMSQLTGCSSNTEKAKGDNSALSTLIDAYNHKEEDKTPPAKVSGKEVQGNVYYEDFTQSISDNWIKKDHVITIDPSYGLNLKHPESISAIWMFMKDNQFNVQNYIVESDIAFRKDCAECKAGFMFTSDLDSGGLNIGEKYYYGTIALSRFVAYGNVITNVSVQGNLKDVRSVVSYTPGEYAHLKVEVMNDKLKVYFNDTFLFETVYGKSNNKLEPRQKLYPGIYANEGNNAYFKNWKITKL